MVVEEGEHTRKDNRNWGSMQEPSAVETPRIMRVTLTKTPSNGGYGA